ncbi:MAG: type II toxin-antitoxin system RelE/ParE family toxin [Bacteroidia bacterium]
MRLSIFVLDEANVQIDNAFDWYEEQQPTLGAKFVLHLDKAFDLILELPFGFPARRRDYRECYIGTFPFVIIYRVVNNKIIIHKVFHTSRNPKKKRAK